MSATVASNPAVDGSRTIIVAALLATFMQAATISLPNAALLYIEGSLSMSDDEVGWIFTSYITASVVTMTMARWLAGRYGRKAVYQSSIAIFALGLVLATRATTPLEFIGARIVQGAASGTLAPLSLVILLDILPSSKHARITQVAAITLLVGLLSGPTIGGWLSDYHGWRSLFYLSLAMAGCVFVAMAFSLPEKRAGQTMPFDFFGLTTFSLATVALQMMLDRGERLEWFDSAEICVEAAASLLGFYLFLVHVLTSKTHFLDKTLFRDRNFVLSAIMYFAFGFVLLPTIALTSPMLDELLQYPADTTGYMAIPRSLALVGAVIVTTRLAARIDNRMLIAGGMALVIYANWRMLGFSPLMDWQTVVVAGVFQGAGLGILLPTLTKTAFSTLDPAFRPEGTAFFNVSRLYGSTLGIAVVLDFFYDNTQAMHVALAKDLVPYRAAAHVTGSVATPGLASLNDMITGQAAFIGVIDQFEVMMIAMLIVSPLVLFLRKAPSSH
jgi:MFS transporter, DHA2 family, multidrug resistance protein